jgi:hypothetical protein
MHSGRNARERAYRNSRTQVKPAARGKSDYEVAYVSLIALLRRLIVSKRLPTLTLAIGYSCCLVLLKTTQGAPAVAELVLSVLAAVMRDVLVAAATVAPSLPV